MLQLKPNQLDILRDLKCAMRMSSYLLALAVGRFDTIQAETANEPTKPCVDWKPQLEHDITHNL